MVLWSKILSDVKSEDAVVDFVEGNLKLRDLKSRLDIDARKEINKAASNGTNYCRHIARKALRRRNVRYSLVE